MVAEKNKVVEVSYELWVDNGDNDKVFFEKAEKDAPLAFLFGGSGLLEDFEENIEGLKVGDTFDFFIEYDKAYGDYDENKKITVPASAFEIDGKLDKSMLQVGQVIPMQDGEGNQFQGEILSVEGDKVQMDFNHPLAGMDLYFKGEVISIREATEEEIDHGHVHGAGGAHH